VKPMAKETQNKRTVWYEIRTTDELEGVIFFADKVTVSGSFVEFRPYESISKSGTTKMKDIALIFPERVVVEIVHRKTSSIKQSER
jgi:hypothetical protein